METNDLIRLITAVVLEVIRLTDDSSCKCKFEKSSLQIEQVKTHDCEKTDLSVMQKGRREILTVDDIKLMQLRNNKIVVNWGDMLTPLAADYIRDNKLEIVHGVL